MHDIPAGNYEPWGRWSVLRHVQNNGCQHAPTPPTLWWRRNPLGHEACARLEAGAHGGECVTASEKAQWSSGGADLRLWTTTILLSSSSPAATLRRVYSAVSPMWESGGNGFDLLHPEPLGFGVKQNMGQWHRMFFLTASLVGVVGGRLRLCLSWNCGRSPPLGWRQRSLKKEEGGGRKRRGSQRGQHSFEMYG